MSWLVRSAHALRAHEGFSSCGDAVYAQEQDGAHVFALIDALGHGPDAERSARAACAVLAGLGTPELRDAFLACDAGLSGLREVVMAMVRFDARGAHFGGIGNVEIIGPAEVARPASQVGRVGRGLRSLREVALPAAAGQRWVLASDGIRPRALRGALEASAALPPEEAAQQILALAGRTDDDASVLVLDLAEVA
jgi:hypothetical protein